MYFATPQQLLFQSSLSKDHVSAFASILCKAIKHFLLKEYLMNWILKFADHKYNSSN